MRYLATRALSVVLTLFVATLVIFIALNLAPGDPASFMMGTAGDLEALDDPLRRLQQVFFFSRADTIYAGTNEIQLNLIAERGLGMPRG